MSTQLLLLYILWDDWPIFMISGSNQQLQQQLEYTRLKPECHSWWISKMQSGREDALEERYTIKFCFKLGKNATDTYGMRQSAFRLSCMNQASVFKWYKRFKEGRESVRDDERNGRSKEVNTPELIGQTVRVRVTMMRFSKRFLRKRPALFKSDQWHFHQDNAPVHNPILVTDYLTRMGIKTLPQLPYSPEVAPCDFWLFPKLRRCRYETIEEIKGAVTKVIDTLTQEDFHGAFHKLLGRYNKFIAAQGNYFEGDLSFMCVLSIKVPTRRKSGNLFNDPRICMLIFIFLCNCFLRDFSIIPT